jgi:hypothetical protein
MVGVVMNRIYMIGGYEVGSSRMMDGLRGVDMLKVQTKYRKLAQLLP